MMIRGSYTPEANKLPPPPPKRTEAERLLCAIVLEFGPDMEIRHIGQAACVCSPCRAWRQAREYVRALEEGRANGENGKDGA